MEVLQLRYFFDAAQTESFAKTAEKFNVPATSVSASIKRLEKELGCCLFHRTCNRIHLSEQGKRLQQSLTVVFDELEQAVQALRPASPDLRDIKMLVRAARTAVTDAIIRYKTQHPNISFRTVFDFNETNLDKYDIIIDTEAEAYPQHCAFPLYETVLRIRAAASSPLCGQKLTLAQLKDQPFLSTGEQNSIHHILMHACKSAGFTPNIVVQCNDINCYERYLEAGVGIGPGREFKSASVSGNIVTLNVTDFQPKQVIYCYYKKEADYGNVRNFLQYLQTAAKQGASISTYGGK